MGGVFSDQFRAMQLAWTGIARAFGSEVTVAGQVSLSFSLKKGGVECFCGNFLLSY